MDDYTECAFCNQPIDYCQGHGIDNYAVRVQQDGEAIIVEFYETEEQAFDRFDVLRRNLQPGHHLDIYDQAGDVSAQYANPDHA